MSHYFDQILNQVPYYHRMKEKSKPLDPLFVGSQNGVFAGLESTKPVMTDNIFTRPNKPFDQSDLIKPVAPSVINGVNPPMEEIIIPYIGNGYQTKPIRPQAIQVPTNNPHALEAARNLLYPYVGVPTDALDDFLSIGFDSGLQKNIHTPRETIRPWIKPEPADWQKKLMADRKNNLVYGVSDTQEDPVVTYAYHALQKGNLSEMYSPESIADVLRAIEYDRSMTDDPFSLILRSYMDGAEATILLGGVLGGLTQKPISSTLKAFGISEFDHHTEPLRQYRKRHPLTVNPMAYENRHTSPYSTHLDIKDSTLDRSFDDLTKDQKGFLIKQIMDNTPGKFSDALNSYLLGISTNDPDVHVEKMPGFDKEPEWYADLLNTGKLPNPPRTPVEYQKAIELMDLKNEYEEKVKKEIDRQNKRSLFWRLPVSRLREALNTPDYHSPINIDSKDIGTRKWTQEEQDEINRAFMERDRSRFRDTIRQILMNNGYDPSRLDQVPDNALRYAFEVYQDNRNDYLNEMLSPTISYIEKLRREFGGFKKY